jgi:alanine racemase
MRYTIAEIIDASKGLLVQGSADAVVDHVIYDSRKINNPHRSIFVAIVGRNHNGHQYIQDAYNKGVRCFIIQEEINLSSLSEACMIRVNNSLRALQLWAKQHRQKFSYPVWAITGSNGKTIVKEWLNQLLSPDLPIVRSPKSFNSQLGVPLSVLQLDVEYQLAIIEAGISEPHEMDILEEIIQPNWGIFTMIGAQHQEHFSSVEEKINEKLQLFKNCELLFYNSDDTVIKTAIDALNSNIQKISWGKNDGAFLHINNITKGAGKTIIEASYLTENIQVEIPFSDDASIENACLCLLILTYLQMSKSHIQQRFSKLSPVDMRLQLISGSFGMTLINDAYSSDFTSLEIALDFLQRHAQSKPTTVILSDMRESGLEKNEVYTKINELLIHKGVTHLVGIGPEFILHQNIFKIPSKFFESTLDFLQKTKPNDHSGQFVLIKGARDFGFEKIVRAFQEKTHETVLEIHLDALVHNFHFYKNKLQPDVKMMVMVKAAGYGAGSVEVASVLAFNKADYLAVAYVDEGIALRQAGISLPIMVMNSEISALDHLVEYHLEPEIYSMRSLRAFIEVLEYKNTSIPYPVHLKLDTGMHRLGFEEKDIPELKRILKENKSLKIASIFSHLVATDNPEHDDFTRQQLSLFQKMASEISSELDYKPLWHIANTGGIERLPESQFDMVRLGIGLYGVSANESERNQLRTVGQLKTVISQIKHIKAGESVGYNRNFIAPQDMTIATIPMGYADGLKRSLSNGKGSVWIQEQACPIVGNVCMDMTMVDISHISCKEGDPVLVIGNIQHLEAIAKASATIPYEILTSISQRVKRIYLEE